MSFVGVLVLSVLVEAVINALKPIWSAETRDQTNLVTFYAALVAGVLLSVLGGVDLFEPAGVPLDTFPLLEPWAGFVFTGVILSRGANVVADLIKSLRDFVGDN